MSTASSDTHDTHVTVIMWYMRPIDTLADHHGEHTAHSDLYKDHYSSRAASLPCDLRVDQAETCHATLTPETKALVDLAFSK